MRSAERMYAPHGMVVDRVSQRHAESRIASNRPMDFVTMARRVWGDQPNITTLAKDLSVVCEAGMAQVTANLVCAGFDEALPQLMAYMLKHDRAWKTYGPGRPPRDVFEYLLWHRRRNKAMRELREAQEREAAERAADPLRACMPTYTRQKPVMGLPPEVVKERKRASRRAHQVRMRDARREVARRDLDAKMQKAHSLLDEICAALSVERHRVVSKGKSHDVLLARGVFVCIVRDTTAVGELTYQNLNEILGIESRRKYPTVQAHNHGKTRGSGVIGAICDRLGIEPPAYARKAGAA